MIPNIFNYIVLSMISLFVHEFGHYLVAKEQGIFKSLSLNPLIFRINLKKCYRSRYDYAFGFTLSVFTLPLWLFFGYNIYFVMILLFLVSIGDLIIIVGWKKPINLGIVKFVVDKEEGA